MRRLLLACVVVVGCGGPARPRVVTAPPPVPAPVPVIDTPAPPVELLVLDAVIGKVRDEYVDGTRVNPRAMLLGALDAVQRDIAEVMTATGAAGEIDVQVNARHQVFATADVDSLAMLATRLGEILRFVAANVGPAAKPAEIELAAVNGFLATLDPHSVAMDPEVAREFKVDLSGAFGGVGIVIGIGKDATTGQRAVVVNALIAGDTPARRAGLEVGDRIVMMDEESTAAFSLEDAMSRLRGPVDTAILLAVQRAGVEGLTLKTLTRAVIQVSAVSSQRLDKHVGYIKIDSFSQSVGADVERAVVALRAQGVKAWVLDLRGNPGGAMAQAVKVVDLFVDAGAIVITQGEHSTREEQLARSSATDDRLPLAVLVDRPRRRRARSSPVRCTIWIARCCSGRARSARRRSRFCSTCRAAACSS